MILMKPLSSVLLLNGRGVVQVSSAIRLPSRACRYLLVFAIKYKRLTRGGGVLRGQGEVRYDIVVYMHVL